jgi:hypothetical protein
MFGQWQQRAMVMKFSKKNMNLDWKIEIKDAAGAVAPASSMHEIYSYVQPPLDDWIYACGYRWEDPTQETYRKAVTLKMSTNGDVQALHVWGDAAAVTNRDTCRAVAYDSTRGEVVFMLETTSSVLRPDYERYSRYSASDADILMVVMRPSGAFVTAFNINMDTASVSLGVGGHSMYVLGDDYIFGGMSFGYKTKY